MANQAKRNAPTVRQPGAEQQAEDTVKKAANQVATGGAVASWVGFGIVLLSLGGGMLGGMLGAIGEQKQVVRYARRFVPEGPRTPSQSARTSSSSTEATMQSNVAIYHVLPMGAVWKVGLPGNSQPSSFHTTREDARNRPRRATRSTSRRGARRHSQERRHRRNRENVFGRPPLGPLGLGGNRLFGFEQDFRSLVFGDETVVLGCSFGHGRALQPFAQLGHAQHADRTAAPLELVRHFFELVAVRPDNRRVEGAEFDRHLPQKQTDELRAPAGFRAQHGEIVGDVGARHSLVPPDVRGGAGEIRPASILARLRRRRAASAAFLRRLTDGFMY